MHRVPVSAAFAACLLALSVSGAAAGPVLELKPGLWAHDSEVWINGQPLMPSLQALRAKVRSQLSEAQRREADRQEAAQRQSCLAPQEARIDLARYLEKALSNTGGPWQCEVNADQLTNVAASGRYACHTGAGGQTQGRFSASYGPTSYKLELNGRGNAVDGRNGQALGPAEVEHRMLSTGRWVSSDC